MVSFNLSGTTVIIANSTSTAAPIITCEAKTLEVHEQWQDFIICGLAIALFSMLGMVSNLINIFIFVHHKMRSVPMNVYLIFLSMADIGVLLSSFLMISMLSLSTFVGSPTLVTMSRYCRLWTYPFALIAQTVSVWLTVSVALFRYVGICLPLHAAGICRRPIAYKNVLGVFIASVALNITRFFELDAVPCFDSGLGVESIQIWPNAFRSNHTYKLVYYCSLYTVIMFAVPFAVLSFVNTRAIYAVRNSYRMRARSDSCSSVGKVSTFNTELAQFERERRRETSTAAKERNEMSTTMMLIAIVFLFIVCNTLAFVANLVETVMTYRSRPASSTLTANPRAAPLIPEDQYQLLVDVSNLLVVLNTSSNIFVYLTFSRQYRRLFMYFICRSGPPPRSVLTARYLPLPVIVGQSRQQSNAVVVASKNRVLSVADLDDAASLGCCGRGRKWRRESNGALLTSMTNSSCAAGSSTKVSKRHSAYDALSVERGSDRRFGSLCEDHRSTVRISVNYVAGYDGNNNTSDISNSADVIVNMYSADASPMGNIPGAAAASVDEEQQRTPSDLNDLVGPSQNVSTKRG